MTELEKAARQALEALESYHGYMEPLTTVFGGPRVPAEQSTTGKVEKAITALRRALEQQPAEEPLATLWQHGETGRTRVTMPGDITDCDASWFKAADLYTRHQPAAQWVGLTDDEIYDMYNEPRSDAEMIEFARAIEAKLREKNGGGA